MKICFPVESDNGLDSMVYGHFGSAPIFVVYDSTTNTINSLNNMNLKHEHGRCSPIQALNGQLVDAIVVGGIGAGAINKLNAMGIKVFRASENTVQKNIELLSQNALPQLTLEGACKQHGGCA